MNEYAILAATLVGGVAGGALGARISAAPMWKGALAAGLASIVQLVIGELGDIEEPLVNSLTYLAAVGIIGGRWGMGLTGRQLSLVVIGSFLLALAAAVPIVYFFPSLV
ncbi:hypothetical protein [Jiella mangrovi]|uniref:GlsB/YeaQ/YmgE family stress response membrane protein n=1 Tax=Jiella mangrovi TaxID=2821407 RepID=A0ABS4BKK6_9HYPH|nr:hypothetical protein [Jiella mangrovi]MBP0617206.1 hypothetical protein [Jiella mangrovi]